MSNYHYSIKASGISKLNIKLLSVSTSKAEDDWKSIPHTHPFTELFFVTAGNGFFLCEQDRHPIKSGDLIITPPYTEHTEQSGKTHPLEYFVLGIDKISFLGSNQSPVQILQNFGKDSAIPELLKQILLEAKTEQYASDIICQNLLEILLLKIIRSRKLIPISITSVKMTKECAQIKQFIDKNYAQRITLDTLTGFTHMNKYYLVHSFTKYTGMSPIQYLNKRRLESACYLLTSFNYSISDIASMTGFSSQSYFTQAFRKTYGTTPVKYRQTHIQKNAEPDNEMPEKN